MSAQSEPSPVCAPEGPTIADETCYPTWSSIEGLEAQVVVRTVRLEQGGVLTSFAVMLQVRSEGTDEGWMDVERVDCAHGEVHVDLYRQNGAKEKSRDLVPLECRSNLDKALTWAMDYIWDIERRTIGWA